MLLEFIFGIRCTEIKQRVRHKIEYLSSYCAVNTLALKTEWERPRCMDFLSSGIMCSTRQTNDCHWPLWSESPTNISLFPRSFLRAVLGLNLRIWNQNQVMNMADYCYFKNVLVVYPIYTFRYEYQTVKFSTLAIHSRPAAIPSGDRRNLVFHFWHKRPVYRDMGSSCLCREA